MAKGEGRMSGEKWDGEELGGRGREGWGGEKAEQERGKRGEEKEGKSGKEKRGGYAERGTCGTCKTTGENVRRQEREEKYTR